MRQISYIMQHHVSSCSPHATKHSSWKHSPRSTPSGRERNQMFDARSARIPMRAAAAAAVTSTAAATTTANNRQPSATSIAPTPNNTFIMHPAERPNRALEQTRPLHPSSTLKTINCIICILSNYYLNCGSIRIKKKKIIVHCTEIFILL